MDDLVQSFRHCLARLMILSGRDTPGLYWPYVLTLVVAYVIVSVGAIVPAMIRGFSESFTAIQEAAREGRQADADAITNDMTRNMMADMQSVTIVTSVVFVILCLLVLSATVRRLHDRDKSGWWSLFGFGPAALGMAAGYWLNSAILADPDFLTNNMPLIQGVGWAPYVGYAILMVQLVQGGTPGPNRYGAPPEV